MLDSIFTSVLSDSATSSISFGSFMICMGASLVIGIVIALVFSYRNAYSKSFVITISLLPAIVSVIIMMVNGNIGAGVAVAGAFSLVRFRSMPGSAKEICAIFLAMAAGLATGMGYIAYGFLFVILLCLANYILTRTNYGSVNYNITDKTIKITIPEDLDYTDIFEDVFDEFTSASQLISVKTVNMGSLYRLTYNVTLKDPSCEKDFIDTIRCRNGNLEVSSSLQCLKSSEL